MAFLLINFEEDGSLGIAESEWIEHEDCMVNGKVWVKWPSSSKTKADGSAWLLGPFEGTVLGRSDTIEDMEKLRDKVKRQGKVKESCKEEGSELGRGFRKRGKPLTKDYVYDDGDVHKGNAKGKKVKITAAQNIDSFKSKLGIDDEKRHTEDSEDEEDGFNIKEYQQKSKEELIDELKWVHLENREMKKMQKENKKLRKVIRMTKGLSGLLEKVDELQQLAVHKCKCNQALPATPKATDTFNNIPGSSTSTPKPASISTPPIFAKISTATNSATTTPPMLAKTSTVTKSANKSASALASTSTLMVASTQAVNPAVLGQSVLMNSPNARLPHQVFSDGSGAGAGLTLQDDSSSQAVGGNNVETDKENCLSFLPDKKTLDNIRVMHGQKLNKFVATLLASMFTREQLATSTRTGKPSNNPKDQRAVNVLNIEAQTQLKEYTRSLFPAASDNDINRAIQAKLLCERQLHQRSQKKDE